MAKFTLTMECDNAAFEDSGALYEIGRILRDLAADLMDGHPTTEKLRDINGNSVGRWQYDD